MACRAVCTPQQTARSKPVVMPSDTLSAELLDITKFTVADSYYIVPELSTFFPEDIAADRFHNPGRVSQASVRLPQR